MKIWIEQRKINKEKNIIDKHILIHIYGKNITEYS